MLTNQPSLSLSNPSRCAVFSRTQLFHVADRRPRPVRSKPARGFTLLEMLVVMVIIGLLAGLVGPRMFGKVDSSKVQTAQTQIKMLRSAVGIMQLDIGIAPPQEQGLKWLTEPPADEKLKSLWKGPYIDGKLPLDPWSNPFVYKVPGHNGQPFSIISYGLDGKEGGEGLAADLTN